MTWTNWARTASCTPREVLTPGTRTELVDAVGRAVREGRRLRPIGSGHSFTAVAAAPDVQLDLSRWTGVVSTDLDAKQVTLRSGTRLWQVPGLLAPTGLAMANLGDIDRQSIAGAVSTSTHGTGLGFGGLSGQVVGLTLLTGTGDEVRVDASDPDLLDAMRVSLGALGVITEVTLQLVDAFDLHTVERVEPWADVTGLWRRRVVTHDHLEFFWFGHSDEVITRTTSRHAPGSRPRTPHRPVRGILNDQVLGNGLFAAVCRLGAWAPRTVPALNRLTTRAWGAKDVTGASHDVFAHQRRVRFAEMEYAVGLDDVPEVLGEIRTLFRRDGWAVTFPIEVRASAPDTAWLATNHARETGYIAVHQHVSTDYRPLFAAIERIFAAANGRPHWGKLHTLGAAELSGLYPRFADFQRLRDTCDPNRVFTNDHLEHVLGR